MSLGAPENRANIQILKVISTAILSLFIGYVGTAVSGIGRSFHMYIMSRSVSLTCKG